MRRGGFWKALGPGLLFAAAAVGASHLVQSTRAGAEYGLALVGVVILANLAKYPAFRFGPQYAAATGTSLLEGYRRQGKWALLLFGVLTAGTMFTVTAAVTVVTAGLAIATLKLPIGAWVFMGLTVKPAVSVSAVILAVCCALLVGGRYRWLDRAIRVLIAVLTVSTLVATALSMGRLDWSQAALLPQWTALDIAFIVALIGWMPAPVDLAVWQSLWTLARRSDTGHRPTSAEASLDFHIGYFSTAILALCFLAMGAGVLHARGVELATSSGAFAVQVIQLFTATLGSAVYPVIGAAALAVMFSTTLTVADAYPRAVTALIARFRESEAEGGTELAQPRQKRLYQWVLIVNAVGALVVLVLLLSSLLTLVDIATTLSFLTGPILAWLNHRAITNSEVPERERPRFWLLAMSWVGIVFQAGFALYYLTLRFAR